ncbi:hypothetical protein E3P99_03113 [Wallemia hederae]|uniref:Large ribosomal subunit protein mL44 n=1 Tax=Wallemia hederae TaxID=1540922 RepID=A0A4T0FH71_9BASI|nr:hypothetical protein E3P99_03113 [Wallemia hederae]
MMMLRAALKQSRQCRGFATEATAATTNLNTGILRDYIKQQFPTLPGEISEDVALRAVTHKSIAGVSGDHQSRLSFLGRRTLRFQLMMHLMESGKGVNSEEFRCLDTVALGDKIGRDWELEKVMRFSTSQEKGVYKEFDKKDYQSLNLDGFKPANLPLTEYTVECLLDLEIESNLDFFIENYFLYYLKNDRVSKLLKARFDGHIAALLIREYITQSSISEDSKNFIVQVLPTHSSTIYAILINHFKSESYRLQSLQLVFNLVSQQSIHAHQLISSDLFQLIILSSLTDNDSSVISLINCIYSILLPKFQILLSKYIPTFLAFIGRILVWKRRKNAFIHSEIINEIDKLAVTPKLTLKNSSFDQLLQDSKFTPSPSPLFTFLYGIFPANTLAFLRSPIEYLKSFDFENPYNQDLDQWLYEDLIKARSLPLLRTHLIHPFFLKYPLNDPHHELTQTSVRWPDAESQAILAQCAVLEINAASIVEYGRRIAEGIIVDGNTLLNQENANLSQLDAQTDQSIIYLPESKALRDSIHTARKKHDEGRQRREDEGGGDSADLETDDIKRDYTYEQYIKGQLLMRLGQLHRRRLAEARDEDAQQSLYIHLRELSSRLSQAQAALSNARSEAAKTHARHVTWTDELQRKVKYFREEKKNWDAEAVGLRGERSASEEIIRVNLGRLADSGNRIFELENQIREWTPKIEEFDKLQERNKELVKSLADRDDDLFRHDEQRREMQILLGRFNVLKTMTKAERDARVAAENEARKSRNESDQLRFKNEHLESRLRALLDSRHGHGQGHGKEVREVSQVKEVHVHAIQNTDLVEEFINLRATVERLEAEKRESSLLNHARDDESSDDDVAFVRREGSKSPPMRSPGAPSISLFPASVSKAWTQSQPNTPYLDASSGFQSQPTHSNEQTSNRTQRTRHVRSPTLSSAPSFIAGLGLATSSTNQLSKKGLGSSIKAPPSEARGKRSVQSVDENSSLPKFNTKEWAASVPLRESSLVALANRLGLAVEVNELETSCTHSSFNATTNNSELEFIGNTFLGLVATEHLHLSYPNLPLKPLKAAVSMLVGPKTCAAVSREWGAHTSLRWKRESELGTTLHEDAMASVTKSIVGLLLKKGGVEKAHHFVKAFFLSRNLDLRSLLKFENPVTVISQTAAKFGYSGVDVKLLKETGRYTQSPVYIVGVFADNDIQLGEGFGSSLKMAKYRAATNALHQLYLHYRPDVSLPSSTLFLDGAYESSPLGKSERESFSMCNYEIRSRPECLRGKGYSDGDADGQVRDSLNPVKACRRITLFQLLIFFAAWFCWLMDSYDFFSVSLSSTAIAERFNKDSTEVSTAITLTLLLRPVGALVGGVLSDLYSRKWVLVTVMVVVGALSLATGYCDTFQSFLGVRALFGIFMGAVWGPAASLSLENLPREARGLFSGIFQQGYACGYLVASCVNLSFVPSVPRDINYRALFFLGAGLSWAAAIVQACVPEGAVTREIAAEKRIKKERGEEVGMTKDKFIQQCKSIIRDYWPNMLLAFWMMVLFAFFSHASQDLLLTMYTESKCFSHFQGTQLVIIANTGSVVGGFIGGIISQKVGRRLTMVLSCIVAGAFIPLWVIPTSFDGIAAGGFLVQIGVQSAWAVVPVYMNELSPPHVRALFGGLAYNLGLMVASASAQIESRAGDTRLISTCGHVHQDYATVSGIFVGIIAALILITALFAWENKGRDLGVSEGKEGKEQVREKGDVTPATNNDGEKSV